MSLGFLEGAANWLAELTRDRPVRRILDIGSGPGVGSCVLASAFPGAVIGAVDGSAPLLERASARAARLGLGERLVVTQQDLPDGLDLLEPADIVWASRVVHHLGDQEAAVRRMAALVRPGGVLAIAEGGLSLRSLPRDIGIGRPGLEARLDVAQQDWFSEMRAAQPGAASTAEHWPGILADAGLTPCGTRSFLVDHTAPLDARTRAVVVGWWGGIRERLADQISAEDRATVERLLDPQDEEGLYRRPDLFVLMATTVHAGRATTP
ncbi:class I SAM-dependent methyltransferase [Pseudonocardia bannensis]|uniref:Class I SAM-dependent methyltransferase n=2 Tax=Pseudonocardia bannensis TaxID=630973 RepID=A0A848DNR7_9PSEU|nr:class I SAM-dependent methyltransferase [Pseudonocardia bannensis]